MGSDYPKREKFFFCKFARAVYLLGLASQVSTDGIALLLAVASVEDSLKYLKAPNFWNAQLMNMCGFHTEGTLIRVRQKLVDSGVLHYEKGSKSRAGTYWVVATPEAEGAYDTLHHEEHDGLTIESESKSVGNIEVNAKLIRNSSVTQALPSYPVPEPEPVPIGKEQFHLSPQKEKKPRKVTQYAIPSMEEIRTYAQEIKAQSEPEGFFDYFEGREWHFKGGDRVKNWQAAFRTWERNNKKFSSEGSANGHHNGNGHAPDQFGVRKPKRPMVPVPLPGQTETIFERQAREDRITDLKEVRDAQ